TRRANRRCGARKLGSRPLASPSVSLESSSLVRLGDPGRACPRGCERTPAPRDPSAGALAHQEPPRLQRDQADDPSTLDVAVVFDAFGLGEQALIAAIG